ncbi:NADPH-dependent ferric siderophore reductase [Jatrophihabitans sp. GAS493]|uniref:siderophore-interacting protein n=1 Tax=Jatrophihabitans sp. GAS493 TaxID=1907575 RepID=UPI000BB71259|nr:siderophore-interacting protein [Jatrophihabitans sp. GAS493]SOD70798.1 NADPH-dependent ferric siderophore reductase [Jatrophihabitans sp. GAS493]
MTSIRRTPLHTATVTAASDLTPRMRRVTVTAPTLVGVAVNPAQDVELVLAEPSGRRVKRRYTIRFARPEIGEWDLDMLLHQEGPGSQWAADAKPGDAITFFGPRGRLKLTEADWDLFVGDESSLPAIAALLEALHGDGPGGQPRRARAFIEVEGAGDELPIQAGDGVELDLRWIHRGGLAAGTPTALAPQLDGFVSDGWTASGIGHAYLLGESRTVVALRAHLAPLQLSTEQIFTKGYWNLPLGSDR